ncbi:MAG: hypothetical protein KKF44_08080 [Nanoarchaeota archaeon]|nr:hypothetical protein [Nanoarchaeota archaeon]
MGENYYSVELNMFNLRQRSIAYVLGMREAEKASFDLVQLMNQISRTARWNGIRQFSQNLRENLLQFGFNEEHLSADIAISSGLARLLEENFSKYTQRTGIPQDDLENLKFFNEYDIETALKTFYAAESPPDFLFADNIYEKFHAKPFQRGDWPRNGRKYVHALAPGQYLEDGKGRPHINFEGGEAVAPRLDYPVYSMEIDEASSVTIELMRNTFKEIMQLRNSVYMTLDEVSQVQTVPVEDGEYLSMMDLTDEKNDQAMKVRELRPSIGSLADRISVLKAEWNTVLDKTPVLLDYDDRTSLDKYCRMLEVLEDASDTKTIYERVKATRPYNAFAMWLYDGMLQEVSKTY